MSWCVRDILWSYISSCVRECVCVPMLRPNSKQIFMALFFTFYDVIMGFVLSNLCAAATAAAASSVSFVGVFPLTHPRAIAEGPRAFGL